MALFQHTLHLPLSLSLSLSLHLCASYLSVMWAIPLWRVKKSVFRDLRMSILFHLAESCVLNAIFSSKLAQTLFLVGRTDRFFSERKTSCAWAVVFFGFSFWLSRFQFCKSYWEFLLVGNLLGNVVALICCCLTVFFFRRFVGLHIRLRTKTYGSAIAVIFFSLLFLFNRWLFSISRLKYEHWICSVWCEKCRVSLAIGCQCYFIYFDVVNILTFHICFEDPYSLAQTRERENLKPSNSAYTYIYVCSQICDSILS